MQCKLLNAQLIAIRPFAGYMQYGAEEDQNHHRAKSLPQCDIASASKKTGKAPFSMNTQQVL